MNRFVLLVILFIYYMTWLILPMFEFEDRIPYLFPIPSVYAIYLPIWLLLIGFTLVGTFLGFLLLTTENP
ncbi:hypothetical protein TBLA_0D01590 [Henningerozyma blattae CBS 6284]|uniref:Dolichol phosphate-mannose biosynthesis regulatory protein n=1 Tax=Henningerozyma blattae (strain ATCC 34711 / CBS 6284 / DSM 70876 / NBRC 10599 / NRRL Y-10934 / UCD 77-7) TaxID=1071380 RepID=I2H2R5_HENB6|nr:hypothetical protein TBLA_0D01590 [Tetrapisispora blattae CBS 6284]CCH60667.1 hypothetical protein TBLA_0D01590 [Tetrapisispora blattae CBS 6284]